MLDDFLVRAGLAAVGVAVAAAPLGCFVVWRRMAYFGDATAHAAIPGVALALALQVPVTVGVLVAALTMAGLLQAMLRSGTPEDSGLGVLAHAALALGVVGVALTGGPRVDLEGYLFGDILAVSRADLALVWAGAAAIVALLAWRWRALLTATLDPDLAYAAGLRPERAQAALTAGLAVTVAVALEIVGALLIVALMLIPATTARLFARTPEAMAAGATAAGVAAALGGLGAAVWLDTPTGPSIVSTAAVIYAAAAMLRPLLPR